MLARELGCQEFADKSALLRPANGPGSGHRHLPPLLGRPREVCDPGTFACVDYFAAFDRGQVLRPRLGPDFSAQRIVPGSSFGPRPRQRFVRGGGPRCCRPRRAAARLRQHAGRVCRAAGLAFRSPPNAGLGPLATAELSRRLVKRCLKIRGFEPERIDLLSGRCCLEGHGIRRLHECHEIHHEQRRAAAGDNHPNGKDHFVCAGATSLSRSLARSFAPPIN